MAYIYRIDNDINGMTYVGATTHPIEKRFREHWRESSRKRSGNRSLYIDMRKYGIDHFRVSLIEETDNPEEREIFWIEKLQTYKNGYNNTLGGKGKKLLDHDLVIALYKKHNSLLDVAKIMNICPSSASAILKSHNIEVRMGFAIRADELRKPVEQYDKNKKLLNLFPSALAAAEYVGKVTANSNGAASHISDVCKGKRASAYGFIWKFHNDYQ